MDYGHDLHFGVFLAPDRRRAPTTSLTAAAEADLLGPRLGQRAGPPLPAGVPRHLDAADATSPPAPSGSRVFPNVANLPLRPPAVLARSVASPRHPQRRPRRARARRRRVLGRDRGDRRPAPYAARGGRRARGGHRRDPRAVDARAHAAARRRALPAARRQARTVPGAPGRHLARRLQAADARAHRPARRRLAAEPRVRRAGGARRDERSRSTTRRSRRGRSPADVRRLLNSAARSPATALPAGPAGGLGGAAGRPGARRGDQRLRADGRRRPTGATCTGSPRRSRRACASWSRPSGWRRRRRRPRPTVTGRGRVARRAARHRPAATATTSSRSTTTCARSSPRCRTSCSRSRADTSTSARPAR